MLSSWGKSNTQRWARGFAALAKFRAREGHCCPSRHHVENSFKLGNWVSVQRYRKKFLPTERKQLLGAIGFVWDWRDYLWEQNFAALIKFKRREGHCGVPTHYRNGDLKLGWWVATQRRNKKQISAEAPGAFEQDRICVECGIHGSDCLPTKSAANSGAKRMMSAIGIKADISRLSSNVRFWG